MDLARYGGIFLAMAVLFSGMGRQEEDSSAQRPQRRTAPVGGYVTADGTYLLPVLDASPTVRDVFPRANRQKRQAAEANGL